MEPIAGFPVLSYSLSMQIFLYDYKETVSMSSKLLIGKLLLLAGLTLMTASALAAEPADFQDALAKAKAENKMLVIDFYTDW